MIYKTRSVPIKLLILRSLHARMGLPEKYLNKLFSLEKGYEGERLFDQITEKLECDCLILNDLRLKVHDSFFQIDTLIIFSNKLYLFEVKNLEGDYYLESDSFYMKPKILYNNPLIQLSRCESHLRQLLQQLKFYFPVDASVVFINPEFTLYQMPLDKPIISPNQVNRLMKQLNNIPSKLHEKHKLLADTLISLHIDEYPYEKLPTYKYGHLRKGMDCEKCGSFLVSVGGKFCVCDICGYREIVMSAVLRSINEFKLLFPDEKITTNTIYDWCHIFRDKKTISKILGLHYKKVGIRQWTYYE